MDHCNRFESKTTFNLLRAEFLVGMLASGTLLVWNYNEVRWIPAIILFSYIDIFGYIPAVISRLARKKRRIPRYYYISYNAMHSFLTQSLVALVWAYFIGWEWALLVLPLHLCGDRALFGNFMKQFSIPFEPKVLPEFRKFEQEISQLSIYRAGKDAGYADLAR